MRKLNLVIFTIVILITVALSGCIQAQGKLELKKFSSYNEMEMYLKANTEYGYGLYRTGVMEAAIGGAAKQVAPTAAEFSKTNIQVEGVDEADIVKNDGKYIYLVSDNKVYIIDAYPAGNAKILSDISFNGSVNDIFINKNKLIVFGMNHNEPVYVTTSVDKESMGYYPSYSSTSFVKVYDVSDRENPVLTREVSVDGSYYDSRMIGDYVYVIFSQYFYYYEEQPIPLPRLITETGAETIEASEVYYFDTPESNTFTTILSVNTQDDEENANRKVFLMSSTQNLYVSQDNIYVTYTRWIGYDDYRNRVIDEVLIPIVPFDVAEKMREIKNSDMNTYEKLIKTYELYYNYSNSLSEEEREKLETERINKMSDLQTKLEKEIEKTIIHKIAIGNGKIEYRTEGNVPGTVLNQFSMDEYNDYFRIATTTRGTWIGGRSTTKNHVYILDRNLQITGKLEDLAPGESIYSARFIGDRGYLVTFKKIDPLFVIDLKNPYNPTVLGKLKIPGYSDYLHPYDENHIIGIGKETAGGDENFAWYQGIKLSLFDVSDVSNPIEISKYEIGDRGTDSEALREHKAFLFSKSRNLLVIPIMLAEIDESKYLEGVPNWAYGDVVWQGAYVFNLDLTNGFALKGRISHNETYGIYSYYGTYAVKRSLYMDDILYTISNRMIKMNDLNDLSEINKIEIPYEESCIWCV